MDATQERANRSQQKRFFATSSNGYHDVAYKDYLTSNRDYLTSNRDYLSSNRDFLTTNSSYLGTNSKNPPPSSGYPATVTNSMGTQNEYLSKHFHDPMPYSNGYINNYSGTSSNFLGTASSPLGTASSYQVTGGNLSGTISSYPGTDNYYVATSNNKSSAQEGSGHSFDSHAKVRPRFRPQSAMALTSPSSSSYPIKSSCPPRPPSSLGVTWEQTQKKADVKLPGEKRKPEQSELEQNHSFTSVHSFGVGLNGSSHMGHENMAFVSENTGRQSEEPNLSTAAFKSPELRSAWQRLYAEQSEKPIYEKHSIPPMYGEHCIPPVTSSQRLFVETTRVPPKTTPTDGLIRQSWSRQPHESQPQSCGEVPRFRVQSSSLYQSQTSFPGTEALRGSSSPATAHSSIQASTKLNVPHSTTSISSPPMITRESPYGQSASNQDPNSGSNNSSNLSSYSASSKHFSALKAQKGDVCTNKAIGPSSKYPMGLSTHNSKDHTPPSYTIATARDNHHTPVSRALGEKLSHLKIHENKDSSFNAPASSASMARQKSASTTKQNIRTSVSDMTDSRLHRDQSGVLLNVTSVQENSDENTETYTLDPRDNIFDYIDEDSEDDIVTPRVSPISARKLDNITPNSCSLKTYPTMSSNISSNLEPLRKTPDLIRTSSVAEVARNMPGTHTMKQSTQQTGINKSHISATRERHKSQIKHDITTVRSRSLEDVREFDGDSELSFDVGNTILTVEPSDQSEMGTVRSFQGSNSVRTQLNRLEEMYSHVIQTLQETTHVHGKRTRRRWSIGSSDTSSMRQHSSHGRHRRSSGHRLADRDSRAISKRFQRLESHVITLARSIAHLSSEVRLQNSLSREVENVKKEIQELKSQSPSGSNGPGKLVRGNRLLSDYERCQGWVPSLTNPRRVNKLTKFFGQAPPLLEIFLKQLGYEKYLQKFDHEQISMVELPYITEDRLQTLGIPMGPRLRILEEAQLYFRQGNGDTNFV